MTLRWTLLVAVIWFVCAGASSYALGPGQIDDFQDGSTAGWTNGGMAPPVVNINTGGPAGAGDRFIEVTSTGQGGPGSRLTTFNRSQWLGDYTGTGVTALEMDLRNPGSVTLSIRLGFKSGPFNDVGYLSDAFMLPGDSMWYHVVFLLSPATMTAIGNPDPFSTFFMGPGEVRIIDRVDNTGFEGDIIAAHLDIDNIRAVPEPASWILILLGVGAISAGRKKVRRQRAEG